MNRLQIKIIEQAADQPHKLSTWESDFIDDMQDRIGDHGEDYELSDKQNAIINRIGRKLE